MSAYTPEEIAWFRKYSNAEQAELLDRMERGDDIPPPPTENIFIADEQDFLRMCILNPRIGKTFVRQAIEMNINGGEIFQEALESLQMHSLMNLDRFNGGVLLRKLLAYAGSIGDEKLALQTLLYLGLYEGKTASEAVAILPGDQELHDYLIEWIETSMTELWTMKTRDMAARAVCARYATQILDVGEA